MSSFRLSYRSKRRLQGVHPDLVRVVKAAIKITEVDFTVLEGVRSMLRQRDLYAAGATTTLNSRHLTGHAVDLGAWVGGTVRWDWSLYLTIAEAMKRAAHDLCVPAEWGGTWDALSTTETPITASMLSRSFPDGPHYQLPWAEYPL